MKFTKHDQLLDCVISVDDVKAYKPHPSVYKHAVEKLGLQNPSEVFKKIIIYSVFQEKKWERYNNLIFYFISSKDLLCDCQYL